MKHFHFLPPADVNALVLAIKRRPDLWKEDTFLRDYPQGPFGEIESIMLRFPEKRVFDQEEELEKYKRGETQFDQHESVNYPAFDILPALHAKYRMLDSSRSRADRTAFHRVYIFPILLLDRKHVFQGNEA